MYCVYKIVFPDSRIYIGITKNFNLRLKQHSRSRQLCGRLIREFGISNVVYESIFDGTLEECLEIEELLVDDVWLKNPRCVNMATGGAAGAAFTGHTHTENSKLKIRNALIGRVFSEEHKAKIGEKSKINFTGRKLSASHVKNMSIAMSALYNSMSPEERRRKHGFMAGKKHSADTKNKISLSHSSKGGSHHNAKPVVMIDKNGHEKEFDSIRLASEYLGTGQDGITKALTGKSKTGYGYYWKYK